MSSLNGSHDAIMRRLDELEKLGRGHTEERTGVLHRLSTLEVRAKRQDDDEGKLLAGFGELRNVVVAHSAGTHEEIVLMRERLVAIEERQMQILSILSNPKKRSKK